MQYFHSVTLDQTKCKGCTNCLRKCPTEAIRVREGKAMIIPQRCIDCGECIRTCPYHAKVATTDDFASINKFQYRIALPAPALYGQFKSTQSIQQILSGLLGVGFDEVYEVARGADVVSKAVAAKLGATDNKPLISSACPAVVRLIQVRFPELIGNIVDVLSPMEVAAKNAKEEFCEKHKVPVESVGVFFITPCPAKMTSVRNPIGLKKSYVDGAISIVEIYGLLSAHMKRSDFTFGGPNASLKGIGWANSGGEISAVGNSSALAVDGIHEVIQVLEEIENGKLPNLTYFEGLACHGGCMGGPLTFENAYVAKNRLRTLMARAAEREPEIQITAKEEQQDISFAQYIAEQPAMKLDENITKAMYMLENIERITAELPGMDCGSCGAPTCRALAEDIVKGNATEMDCVFRLKERVKNLAQQMIDLSNMKK
ncbi:MAG: [Fe-Fe] hydrogenase large subunit C-terminal domain-containing protein [Eubacteriales bacterium]|nr:[Fe-Fe] hydrogenase large subunit C-terminal domain-containing protein [Eubacteriales bacterium]